MLYDIKLGLHYDYKSRVSNDRHHLRITPVTIGGVQRVVAASLAIVPKPVQQSSFKDFFGNTVTTIAFAGYHNELDVRLTARVQVQDGAQNPDLSPPIERLGAELAGIWSVGPEAPHHFLGATPKSVPDAEMTAMARQSVERTATVLEAVIDLGRTIHAEFEYNSEATTVDTTAAQAFALRQGVCQDFAHVMIAALRGVGIPAGYVSGFLRTLPPPGKPRLEGADAMHAWVRAWCGRDMGWIDYDPTNAMLVGASHITIGHGRDYSDISPIRGVLKTSGGQKSKQSVDVVVVE